MAFGPLVNLVASLLFVAARINLVLGFFNLIPINPLDGYKVVLGLLPRDLAIQWAELAPYGMYMLIALIFLGITNTLVSTPVNFVMRLLF
jgi:Zn-dependent protease